MLLAPTCASETQRNLSSGCPRLKLMGIRFFSVDRKATLGHEVFY